MRNLSLGYTNAENRRGIEEPGRDNVSIENNGKQQSLHNHRNKPERIIGITTPSPLQDQDPK
jgi:hypothetical protein